MKIKKIQIRLRKGFDKDVNKYTGKILAGQVVEVTQEVANFLFSTTINSERYYNALFEKVGEVEVEADLGPDPALFDLPDEEDFPEVEEVEPEPVKEFKPEPKKTVKAKAKTKKRR